MDIQRYRNVLDQSLAEITEIIDEVHQPWCCTSQAIDHAEYLLAQSMYYRCMIEYWTEQNTIPPAFSYRFFTLIQDFGREVHCVYESLVFLRQILS